MKRLISILTACIVLTGCAFGQAALKYNPATRTVTDPTAPNTAVKYGFTNGANLDLLAYNPPGFYLDRANHTGTQPASTISDFAAAVTSLVGGLGGGAPSGWVTSVNSFTGDVTISKSTLNLENVPNVNATLRANHTGTQLSSTISDFTASVITVLNSSAPVTSVNGFTGAVNITKSTLNLGNADNTSDLAKPVSTAMATALAGKEPLIAAAASDQYYLGGDKNWKPLPTITGSVLHNASQVISSAGQAQARANIGIDLNVNDFAGVDPTGATDSSAGIQLAESTAAGAGKNLIFNGKYIISNKTIPFITKASNVRWSGTGSITQQGYVQGTVLYTCTSGGTTITYAAGTTDLTSGSLYVVGSVLQLPGSSSTVTVTANNTGTRTLTVYPAVDVTLSSATANIYYSAPVVWAYNVNDWTIDGLTLSNVVGGTPNFIGVNSSGNGNRGQGCIVSRMCKRWRVSNCVLKNFSEGIFYQGAENAIISENIINSGSTHTVAEMDAGTYYNPWTYSFGGGGIVSDQISGVIDPPSSGVTITGNVIDVVGLDMGIAVGVQLWGENPTVVSGNTIRGGNSGIQAYMGTLADPGNVKTFKRMTIITGNSISYTSQQGIYLRLAMGCLVSNNQIYKCQLNGFQNDAGTQFGGIVVRVSQWEYGFTSPVSVEVGHLIEGNMVIDTGNPNTSVYLPGTLDGLNAMTATGTSGTPTITVSSATYLAIGTKINIAGSSANPYTISGVSGTTITLSTNLDVNPTGAVVTAYKPGGSVGIQLRCESTTAVNNIVSQSDERFGYKTYSLGSGIYVASNVSNFQLKSNKIHGANYGINVSRSGYYQDINTTGSITSGTTTLTLNRANRAYVGQKIKITGVTGEKTITALVGLSATIDSAADATVASAAIFQKSGTLNAIVNNVIDTVNYGIAISDGYLTNCMVSQNQIQDFVLRGITIRKTQGTRLVDNQIDNGAAGSYGIYVDTGCYNSDYWGGSGRLGQAIISTGNIINNVPTAHNAGSTSGTDSNFFARVIVWDDLVNGQKVGKGWGTAAPSSSGNQQNWAQGEASYRSNAAASGYVGSVCVTAGTFGTLAGVTANTTNGSPVITLNSVGAVGVGNYITIAGVSGTFKVIEVNGLQATLSANCGATVSGATVQLSAPVFKDFGAILAYIETEISALAA